MQPSPLLHSCIYDGVKGYFHISIGVWFTALSVGFVFPEEVTVFASIASGWFGHVLCMDYCPNGFGALKECSSF